MALNKTWSNRPVVLAPQAGETLKEYEDRVAAFAAANPGVLTLLDKAALEDLEARAQAELDDLEARAQAEVPYVNLATYCSPGVANQQAGWDSAVAALGEGGTLFIPSLGAPFKIPLPRCEKRINIVGEGVGSAIEISAGATTDGFIFGSAAGAAIYGATLRDFAIIGGADSARYACVLRRLIECTIEDVYVKAGGVWAVSIEGLLVCKVRMRMPGNNFLLPHASTRSTNGVRVVGSDTTPTFHFPSNANDLDFTIQSITGDGLLMDATIGSPGSSNNEIRGVYQGITGKAIHVKGAFHWKVGRIHLEAAGAMVVENCGYASIGPGAHLGVNVDLINSYDIEIDGASVDRLTIDANCARTKLGRVTYNMLGGGGPVDNGVGTVSDGRLVNATGANTSRSIPGPQESANLLRSDGLRRWDTARPLGSTIGPGTITKAGDGQADTRKLFTPFSGLMSGASAVYFEGMTPDALEDALGRMVTLSAWVYIPSGQVNQPNVVIEANIVGGGTFTGQVASVTDAWQQLTISVPVGVAATQIRLKLRNTVALTGDWYISGTSGVLGRVVPRARPAARQDHRYGEVTWDPPSIVDGAAANVNVAVQGAAVGDVARCSFSIPTGNGMMFTARVVGNNTVQVTMLNKSGATQDLGAGTLRVEVAKWV